MKIALITIALYTLSLFTGVFQLVVLGDMTGAFYNTFKVYEDDERLSGYFEFRQHIGGNFGGLIK